MRARSPGRHSLSIHPSPACRREVIHDTGELEQQLWKERWRLRQVSGLAEAFHLSRKPLGLSGAKARDHPFQTMRGLFDPNRIAFCHCLFQLMQSSGAVFKKYLDEFSEQGSISIYPEQGRRKIHWYVDPGWLLLIDVHPEFYPFKGRQHIDDAMLNRNRTDQTESCRALVSRYRQLFQLL
jgi:hypothetical protein